MSARNCIMPHLYEWNVLSDYESISRVARLRKASNPHFKETLGNQNMGLMSPGATNYTKPSKKTPRAPIWGNADCWL